ncbi:unnamed protein product [Meganyctiphanes norvegica]|uniref:NADH dehydrogenase subunit 4L n=1 Tax=Meganyctiphanes norvegica TaxID=48144 RepID=A0AAV2QVB2_MEGNR
MFSKMSFNCCVVELSSFILFSSISAMFSKMSFNCCVVELSSFILFSSISAMFSKMSFNCCVVAFEVPLQFSIMSFNIALDSLVRVFMSFMGSFRSFTVVDEYGFCVALSCAK